MLRQICAWIILHSRLMSLNESFSKQATAMAEKTLPEELLISRDKIDQIDTDLLNLLAERFALTFRVGEIKALQSVDSFDPEREAQKIEKLREQSAKLNLNPDLVEHLFTQIMKEVVKNHQLHKQRQQQQ